MKVSHTASSDDNPPFRRTLLIGSETLLGAWSEHAAGASHVIAVVYTDVVRVLGIIEQIQPEAVIVEQTLAGTEGGQVLMERLHNERFSRGLEISLLQARGVDRLLSTGPGDIHPHQWLAELAQPLPPRPKRSAARVPAQSDEHVMVDGHAALLLDLSATGVQVRSTVSLRPNQHVRVVLSARSSLKTAGVVVWSMLEGGPPMRYRAGIAFTSPIPALAQKGEEAGKNEKESQPKTSHTGRRSRKNR